MCRKKQLKDTKKTQKLQKNCTYSIIVMLKKGVINSQTENNIS